MEIFLYFEISFIIYGRTYNRLYQKQGINKNSTILDFNSFWFACFNNGTFNMKKLSPYLRLFSDLINSMLLILIILKREYTIWLLIAVAIALISRILADIFE